MAKATGKSRPAKMPAVKKAPVKRAAPAKNLLVKCPSKYNDKPQSSDNSSGLFIVAGTLGLGTAVVAIPLLFNRGKTWS